MGAYYNATIGFLNNENPEWMRYSSWKCDNGAKLMEHSYIGNSYVSSVLSLLHNRKARLVWLCDYHEDGKFNWDKVKEAVDWKPRPIRKPHIIVNHSKKEFISFKEILFAVFEKFENNNIDYAHFVAYKNKEEERVALFIIHPLPLLVNSETEAAGGGDYQIDYPLRSRWAGDIIEVLSEKSQKAEKIKNSYKDISREVILPFDLLFREPDAQRSLSEQFVRENVSIYKITGNLYSVEAKVKAAEEYFSEKLPR